MYMYILDVMVNMLLSFTRRYWGQLSEVRKHVAEQKRREEAATNRLRVQLYQKVRLKMTPLRFYQPGARNSLAGLIAIFVSVHLSQSGEAWDRVNGSSWHVCLFLVCLPTRCKRKQNDASTIDSRGTALVHKRNSAKAAPEAREWQETGG